MTVTAAQAKILWALAAGNSLAENCNVSGRALRVERSLAALAKQGMITLLTWFEGIAEATITDKGWNFIAPRVLPSGGKLGHALDRRTGELLCRGGKSDLGLFDIGKHLLPGDCKRCWAEVRRRGVR